MIDITTLNAMIATSAECEVGGYDCEGAATHFDTHPAGQAQGEDARHGWATAWYCLSCAYNLARDL